MAKRKVTVLVCDWCDATDSVATHKFTLDGKNLTLEACEGCWAGATVTELLDTGHRTRKPRKVTAAP